jgi:hypothetical protein
MNLRVHYFYDPESQHWGYRVPSLHIVGGGHDTREQAEEDARQAILFTLEVDDAAASAPEGEEVGYFHIAVEKVS